MVREVKMKITFCVHGCAIKPIGGHKIIYEYANRLARNGNDVEVIFVSYDNLYQLRLPSSIRILLLELLTDKLRILPGWFKFDKRVKLRTIYDYSSNSFPTADVIIATAAETAYPVFQLPVKCGKKVYFIQDYETWMMKEKKLDETFRLGMCNVAVSTWLKQLIEDKSGKSAQLVSNPINCEVFKITNPIEDRNDHTVGLLWHDDPKKGLNISLNALKIVYEKYPDLKVKMFGATKPGLELPGWIEFTFRANESQLQDLYNSCSVFVCGTVFEGFGLTGAESMACGCLLVSTDYLGVREYAHDSYNALLSPVNDSMALAKNIMRAFENPEMRIRLAGQGAKDISQRNWNISVERFQKILSKLLEH